MNINEYMKNNKRKDARWLCKRVECMDGFSMSVQASEYNYCSPRVTGADYYTQVEVGFPSEKPQRFAEYAETSGWNDEETGEVEYVNYTDTVYGYVPVELVDEEIARHGGINLATE